MSYNVEIKGLTELQARLEKLPAEIKMEANAILEKGAQIFVRNAQRDAPVNFGFLRQRITYMPRPVTNLLVEMVSGAEYSAYMEWGTITRVKVPPELAAYAIQFKGKGIRKTGGIHPRPFFFKQLPLAKAEIERGFAALARDIKL